MFHSLWLKTNQSIKFSILMCISFIYFSSCQNLNKTLTLELMGSNLGNLVSLSNIDQHQLNSLQSQPNNGSVGMLNGHSIIHINQLPQLQQQNSQQNQMSQQNSHNQQQQQQQSQSQTINSMSQFDSLVASLSSSNTINLTQMQQQMNNLTNSQQMNTNNNNDNNNNQLNNVAQIKLDPNGPVYRQNADGIFI